MSQPLTDKEIRTRLKTLDPPKLIDILIAVMEDNNSAIIQAARWNNNEGRHRQGLLSESDYRIERARIISALTSMVDDLEQGEVEAAVRELPEKKGKGTPSPPENGGVQKERIILLLSANPAETGRLQLEKEYQMIHSSTQGFKEFTLRSREQINWRELNAALLDKTIRDNLYIFHFSGHGSKKGEDYDALYRSIAWREEIKESDLGIILFDDQKRGAMMITEDVWFDFFNDAKASCPSLEVLVFNSCFSESLAKMVSKAGLYVIGVRNKVKDEAAIQFSSGFYTALVQGLNLKNAVNSGCRQARPFGLKKMEDVMLFYGGEEVEV